MRKVMMAVLALSLAAPAVRAQQDDKQAAARREMERKMQQLQQQMRDLERELSRMEPGSRVRASARPMFRMFDNHAYLGVTVTTDKHSATDSVGAVLTGLTPGGPADQAGLKPGDVVTAFNGAQLAGRYPAAGDDESEPGRKLVDLASDLSDGDTVKLDYRRGRETHRATVVARDLPMSSWGFAYTTSPPSVHVQAGDVGELVAGAEAMSRVAPVLAGMYDRWFAMELVALNPDLGNYFGTDDGLLVIHAPDDSTLNLKGGDVILAVDGRKPTSQSQLIRILRSYAPGEQVQLDIMRQKRRTTVTARIPERRSRHDGFDWDWERDGAIR